jgi:hypothetical protein
MAIWYTYFVVIWYIFPRFGILDQEKSGNPGSSWYESIDDILTMDSFTTVSVIK